MQILTQKIDKVIKDKEDNKEQDRVCHLDVSSHLNNKN